MDVSKNTRIVTEVLQNDFVTILLDDANILTIKWERQIDFEERKQIFLWGLTYSVGKNVKNWLIDDEQIYIITSQEREWVVNDWPPLAAEAGIKKIAVFLPEDLSSSQLTLTDFTERAQSHYERLGVTQHEVFTDYDTALVWLRS
ncbi:hypothetical protein [Pontibacter pudoricolor]|uniref:hypothetical protein n=1 Tax=Pontibacter pudoricolor TaxID=2694930 RepID=UPI0013919D4F|nr:hypothetical protein [Pontibacter pudoricolor]